MGMLEYFHEEEFTQLVGMAWFDCVTLRHHKTFVVDSFD